MNTIQGVLATVRATERLVLALRLQEGECAVKLTAPTLRRSIGLLWNATAIDVLLLVPSQQLPPVLLENGLTLAA